MNPLNAKSAAKCGYALPLALSALLAISLLLASLAHLPGAVRSTVKRTCREVQQSYLSESAVIAHLEMFPEGFFTGLPNVYEDHLGPWQRFKAGDYSFLAGKSFAHFRTKEWLSCARSLEDDLKNRILSSSRLQRFSGNRRFFEVKNSMTLKVESGDLELRLDSASCGSFSAIADGNILVKGNVHLDTLRLYSLAQVEILGNVNVGWLEIYGAERVSLQDDVRFRGIVLSQRLVEMKDRVNGLFPSFAMSAGRRDNAIEITDKVCFDGAALAPGGNAHLEVSVTLMDSSQTLLPYCMDSKNVVFERIRGGLSK